MYCEEILKISKAENGFILEACCPIKEEPKKGAKMEMMPCCKKEGEVRFVVAGVPELLAKIKEILPKLDVSYSSEDEFDKAFKAATMESK